MNIQSTQLRPRIQAKAVQAQAPAAVSENQPQDKVTFTIDSNDIKAGAIMGGVGLLGAAIGAAAGNYSGAFSGIAGALVGASAGASIAVHTPGEKIKTGLVLGAITGAIAGSSFGGTAAAVAMGVAGATLPYGAIVGLAGSMSS